MLPRIPYRQFHDQTNVAAATLVTMAEFGLTSFDSTISGAELVLHGLLQREPYQESRGFLLRRALRHLFDAGVASTILHDGERTAALHARVLAADPEAGFHFPDDLGGRAQRALSLERDFENNARVLLVEARHSSRGVPIHILLVRREEETYYVMNTATGQDHAYERFHMSAHLASSVRAGAIAFAGRQYMYTGIAVRIGV